jgi:hypothetical protein
VPLESVELKAPMRFDLVEPAAQVGERRAAQAIHANARVLCQHAFVHEAALPQHAQVARHRRLVHVERARELSRAQRTLPQQLDHAAPRGIRQRQEGLVDRRLAHAGVSAVFAVSRLANTQRWPSGSLAR